MSERLVCEVHVSAARRVAIDARFVLEAGITALFGASGAGKTTLVLAIAGLFRPDRGRIELGSRTLFDSEGGIDVRPERRRTALVFQSLALFPHMTVIENVAYGLPRSVRAREHEMRAQVWLERMRVSHVAKRMPATLSGGEAQRVALARALASEPSLLLLDEPFSAMDEPLRIELGDALRDVLSDVRIPALLVTHDARDAVRLADRVIELRDGRVIAREA